MLLLVFQVQTVPKAFKAHKAILVTRGLVFLAIQAEQGRKVLLVPVHRVLQDLKVYRVRQALPVFQELLVILVTVPLVILVLLVQLVYKGRLVLKVLQGFQGILAFKVIQEPEYKARKAFKVPKVLVRVPLVILVLVQYRVIAVQLVHLVH
jgi:hypothetical protein